MGNATYGITLSLGLGGQTWKPRWRKCHPHVWDGWQPYWPMLLAKWLGKPTLQQRRSGLEVAPDGATRCFIAPNETLFGKGVGGVNMVVSQLLVKENSDGPYSLVMEHKEFPMYAVRQELSKAITLPNILPMANC
ncbi:hypothetical protein COP1_031022 [Malus domestica]